MLDYFIIIWNLLEDVNDDECKIFYLRLLVIWKFLIIVVVLVLEVYGLLVSIVVELFIEYI